MTLSSRLCPELLGTGRNRVVYRVSKRLVLKLALNDYGLSDNCIEHSRYRRYWQSDLVQYAPCRILSNGALLMWYVEPLKTPTECPDWADYVDCRQVGRAHDGRIYAYDYGVS